MIAFLIALFLIQSPQDVPNPDPVQPESVFELSMPGESPTEAFGERPTDEETFLITGRVVAIDPEQVRLRRRGEIDADLLLTEETFLVRDGDNVTFDEIPIGSEVEAEFVLRGVDRVVIELRVVP